MAGQGIRQSQLSFDQINHFLTTHNHQQLQLRLDDFEEIYANCDGDWSAILEALGLALSEEQKIELFTILHAAPIAKANLSVIQVLTHWLQSQSVKQSVVEEISVTTQYSETCLFVILSKHYASFSPVAIANLEGSLKASGHLEAWMHAYAALGVFDFADHGTGSRFLEAQLRLNATIQREPFWAFAHFASLPQPLSTESIQQVVILQGTYHRLYELDFTRGMPTAAIAKEIANSWKLDHFGSLSTLVDDNAVITQVLGMLRDNMKKNPSQENRKAIRSACALIESSYPMTLDVMKTLDWPIRAAKVVFLSRAYQEAFLPSLSSDNHILTSQLYQRAQAIRSPLDNCSRIPEMAALRSNLLQELRSILTGSEIDPTHPCAEYWILLQSFNPDTAPNYAQWNDDFKAAFNYDRIPTAIIRQELQDLQQCVDARNIPLPVLHHRVRLAQGFKQAAQYFRDDPYQPEVSQTSLAVKTLMAAFAQPVRVFEALPTLDILRLAPTAFRNNEIVVFTVLGNEYDHRFGPDALHNALAETQHPGVFQEWQKRFVLPNADADSVGHRLTQEILINPAFLATEYSRLSQAFEQAPLAEKTTIAAHILLLATSEQRALKSSTGKSYAESETTLSITLTPSEGAAVSLIANPTPSDGNCAYTAMGIDRVTSAQLLKDNYEAIKEMMGVEIRDEITQLITEISKAYAVYSDETKNTSGVLESKGVEADADASRLLQTLQNKIRSLCGRWETLLSDEVQLATAQLISLSDPKELPLSFKNLITTLNTSRDSSPSRETCDAYIEQVVGTDKVWLPFHAAAPGVERPLGLLDALAKVHNVDFCFWAFSADSPALTLIAATQQAASTEPARRVHVRYAHNHFEGITISPPQAFTAALLMAFQSGTFSGAIEVISEAPLPVTADDEEIAHQDKKRRIDSRPVTPVEQLLAAQTTDHGNASAACLPSCVNPAK